MSPGATGHDRSLHAIGSRYQYGEQQQVLGIVATQAFTHTDTDPNTTTDTAEIQSPIYSKLIK